MERSLTIERLSDVPWRGAYPRGPAVLKFTKSARRPDPGPAGTGSTATHEGGDPRGVDLDLEALPAVDLHDRDPDPVLELERVVAADVDLVEGEDRPRALGQDHVAGEVAQMASLTRIQDDAHAPIVPAGGAKRCASDALIQPARARRRSAGPRASSPPHGRRPRGIRRPVPSVRPP